MPPPTIGTGAKNATALITPQFPQTLAFNTWVTSTTAFPSRAAKADLVERFTQGGQSDQSGPQPSSTSMFFRPQGGSLLLITPLLISTDNDTMSMELHLWEEGYRDGPAFERMKHWTPQFLTEVTCTAGTKVGLGADETVAIIPATARYCDTLAFPTSQAADDAALLPLQTRFMQTATAGNTVARLAIDYVGAPLIELRLKVTTSGAKANAMIKTV